MNKVFLKLCIHRSIPLILRDVEDIFPHSITLCYQKCYTPFPMTAPLLSPRRSFNCFPHPLSFDTHVLTVTKSHDCCLTNSNCKMHPDIRNMKMWTKKKYAIETMKYRRPSSPWLINMIKSPHKLIRKLNIRGRKVATKSKQEQNFFLSLQTNSVFIDLVTFTQIYLSKILIQYVYFVLCVQYDFSVHHTLFKNLTIQVSFSFIG